MCKKEREDGGGIISREQAPEDVDDLIKGPVGVFDHRRTSSDHGDGVPQPDRVGADDQFDVEDALMQQPERGGRRHELQKGNDDEIDTISTLPPSGARLSSARLPSQSQSFFFSFFGVCLGKREGGI